MQDKTLNGESLSITEEKLARLRELLPQAFSEGKVDWEKLRIALGEEGEFSDERYHLNWAGKTDAFRSLQAPTTATLAPCPEESVDFDRSDNVFIEGENLEALKILQKSYFGKVKMIYIDPPYNTGNDHFIYPDRFAESKDAYLRRVGDRDEQGFMTRAGLFRKNNRENGHFHSSWLSMIYPRLFLARNLLREDGVIFVSIDDNEAHNLRMVMNEIFGEENCIGALKRRAARKTAHLSKGMTDICDYVLVYSINKETVSLISGQVSDFTRPVFNEGNKDSVRVIKKGVEAKCKDGSYHAGDRSIRSVKFSLLDTLKIVQGKVVNDCRIRGPFRVSQDLIDKTLYVTKNVGLRRYLLPEEKKKGKVLNDLIDIPELYNEQGTEELEHLFEVSKIFQHPKPSDFIKYLIRSQEFEEEEKDFIVLDFFAGSCPAAHAVMQLNAEDGGNRRFICVQMPEPCDKKSDAFKVGYKTIADIGKERIRRAIKNDDMDVGFKVFKLQNSNFKIWRGAEIRDEKELEKQLKMHAASIVSDAKIENILYELLLKSGFPLTAPIEAHDGWFMTQDGEATLALALERIDKQVIKAILAAAPQKFIALDHLFENNDQLKTNTALQMEDAGIAFDVV